MTAAKIGEMNVPNLDNYGGVTISKVKDELRYDSHKTAGMSEKSEIPKDLNEMVKLIGELTKTQSIKIGKIEFKSGVEFDLDALKEATVGWFN